MTRESWVVRALVEIADTLVGDFDVVEMLTGLASRCVEPLGISAAGVMVATPPDDLRLVASSSAAMRVLELAEARFLPGDDPLPSGAVVVSERPKEAPMRIRRSLDLRPSGDGREGTPDFAQCKDLRIHILWRYPTPLRGPGTVGNRAAATSGRRSAWASAPAPSPLPQPATGDRARPAPRGPAATGLSSRHILGHNFVAHDNRSEACMTRHEIGLFSRSGDGTVGCEGHRREARSSVLQDETVDLGGHRGPEAASVMRARLRRWPTRPTEHPGNVAAVL